MAATQRTRAFDHYNQMHAAVDPEGTEVWCDFAARAAMTNDGHCQFCGKRDHKPVAEHTPAPARGRYMTLLGSQLNPGDFTQIHGEWYRLDEETPAPSRQARVFIGHNKAGGRRTCLVYTSSLVKAWQQAR